MADTPEWLHPSSGRVMGYLGLGLAGVLILIALVGGGEGRLEIGLAGAFLGALVWAALLRPAIGLSASTLVLRNMVETVHVPLAAIESMAIRQVLAVRVGDRRFVSPAIGKSRRQALRANLRRGRDSFELGPAKHDLPYTDYVEQRILQFAENARARAGIRRGSPEQLALAAGVRRVPAWPEIAGIVVTGVAFVGSLFWF